MPCAALALSTLLWMTAGPAPAQAEPPMPPPAVALEPLFAEIVGRAGALKTEAEAMRQTQAPTTEAFKTGIADLAALDMKGQQIVRDRGNDGDLACILRGIAAENAAIAVSGKHAFPELIPGQQLVHSKMILLCMIIARFIKQSTGIFEWSYHGRRLTFLIIILMKSSMERYLARSSIDPSNIDFLNFTFCCRSFIRRSASSFDIFADSKSLNNFLGLFNYVVAGIIWPNII